MASPQIKAQGIKVLSTVHENFKQPIVDLYSISNGDNPDLMSGYKETTQLVQEFLQKALDQKKSIRFLGGNWSWTKVGFTKDWIVSTSRLNWIKRMLPAELKNIHPPDQYIFAQCGCHVMELNKALRSLGRSLKTSGASNGQTIAGLVSNGTHGSAIDYGSSQEFVAGIHLVLAPDTHIYLERASNPIVSTLFIEKLGALHIKDNKLFNAALVSFGSFGFIHGLLIETEPLFLFNVYRKQISMNQVRPLMDSLDFTQTPFLPRPGLRPFHFQVIVNPYDTSSGLYVTVMYKEPYRDNYPKIIVDFNKAGPGEDAPILLGKLTSTLPSLTPLIVNKTLKTAYQDIDNAWGTHGEVFSASLARGRMLSSALGVPVQFTTQVLDIALKLNEIHSYVGVFAFRYVKQTEALLGFTRFPITCVAEFDSFETGSTWRFYNALWKALKDAGIPYTFHWGKINNLDKPSVKSMYGKQVTEWIEARNTLLPKEMLSVFTNSFMVETGLDEVAGSHA